MVRYARNSRMNKGVITLAPVADQKQWSVKSAGNWKGKCGRAETGLIAYLKWHSEPYSGA